MYDVFGRLLSETADSMQTSYTYDNNGNLLTMTDATGTTTRTYDALNRVKTKTVPNIGTSTFEYDIISGVNAGETAEKAIDPKENITTKVHDKAGRLKDVIDGSVGSSEKTTYEYYDNGNRKSVRYPTGIKEEYTYFPDNTLRTLKNKYADGTIMDAYTYTYDDANNQTSKHEIVNGVEKGTTVYTYDALSRLETVTEPLGRRTCYTYDMAGNRVSETVTDESSTCQTSYSYNEQNRLMHTVKSVDSVVTESTLYSYDNNGNQLTTTVNG